jgi:cytoskeletal protein CcmA (bactofilin family)
MDGAELRDNDRNQMSVIGADIVVTGNIEASVDLHIEGKVIGDVRCATLILGESSSVNGHIYAARVKVSGTVDGAIDTKDLAIEATARVTADITYERLRVANGGVIEGKVTRRAVEEAADDVARLKLVEPTPVEAVAAAE